jgi:hypothetical protein
MKTSHAFRISSSYLVLVIALLFPVAGDTVGQTTEFTFHGKFPESGGTASGTYQMEFRLFDQLTAGNQIGSTQAIANVSVTKGTFTVNLDLGSAVFPGADRFLEIAARKTPAEPFTILDPRQKITSVPYSIKSKTAETASTATFAVSSDTANVATRAFDSIKFGGLDVGRFVRFDNNDNVGIGTSTASKLAVAGVIESTSGGLKFPDATTQTTAGLTTVSTAGPLTGDGTPASPLGIASPVGIRDLDHPARQPIQAFASNFETFFVVPAGKVAVIEFVTAELRNSGSTLNDADLTLSTPGPAFYSLAPTYSRQVGSQTLTHYTHTTRIYVTPGPMRLSCFSFTSTVTGCSATVSGYFVNAP